MTLYIIAGGVSKVRNRAKKSSVVSRSSLIPISVYSHLLEPFTGGAGSSALAQAGGSVEVEDGAAGPLGPSGWRLTSAGLRPLT